MGCGEQASKRTSRQVRKTLTEASYFFDLIFMIFFRALQAGRDAEIPRES